MQLRTFSKGILMAILKQLHEGQPNSNDQQNRVLAAKTKQIYKSISDLKVELMDHFYDLRTADNSAAVEAITAMNALDDGNLGKAIRKL